MRGSGRQVGGRENGKNVEEGRELDNCMNGLIYFLPCEGITGGDNEIGS